MGESREIPRLSIGQEMLDGRLVVRGELGRGAMGVVYRADDRRLGREVALKTLANFDADHLYQLKREFRTLAGLSHRNLVQLYELGATGDLWFLILELIEGQELSRWLREKPARPRVLRVLRELAEGLRVLHAAGLMHRDVKPANVMITAGDRAVLLDFGLLAPISRTVVTLTAGTLDYIAPEQLWDESPGAAADWFSFGVVMFEALTGTLPFSGANRFQAMREGLLQRPRALVPDVAPDLDDLIVQLLDPDPARRPGPSEIAKVLEASPTPAPLPPTVRQTTFIGRREALARLHRSLEDVRHGEAEVVHVQGPSGIGKTALVREFVAQARALGDVLVLEGSCHPLESVPYKALDALIDNLGRHLLGLDHRAVLALAPRHAAALLHVFPVLGRVPGVREWPVKQTAFPPSELRRRGCDALREVLAKLADDQTIVLSIDDVQWSDRDSGMMLNALLAPPDAPRLLLLLTSRADRERMPLLDELPSSVRRTDLAVERLSATESLELARGLARSAGLDPDLRTIAEEADGSPFLLGELVRYLRETPAESSDLFSVTHALRSRLGSLSPESRRLLEFVAIAGKPLEIELALDVAGLGPRGRLTAYSLCSASLLQITTQDEQGYLATYHDRLRELAMAEMGDEGRRARHLTLADAIASSRTPDPRTLVGHYLKAQAYSRAAHFALLAAQEAERDLAFDQAVAMYDVIVAHAQNGRDRDVLERRATMLAHAARRTDAALAYEMAADAVEDKGEARTALRVQAAEQFLYGGELQRGLTVMQSVLSDVGVHVPASPTVRSLAGTWYRIRFIIRGSRFEARSADVIQASVRMRLDALWRTTHGMVMLDPMLADVLGGMHLLEALAVGDTSRAVRALGLEAAIEANIGGRWFRTRSRKLLTEAERTASAHGDAYDQAWLGQCRAACAFFEGRWRECIELGLAADARLRKSGVNVSWDLAALHGFMLSSLANLGQLQDLSQRVRELVRDAERRRDQYALRVFRTGDAVLMWLAADQVAEALQLAEDTLRDYEANHFTSQHRHHLVALVQSHLYAGECSAAWARLEQAWPPLRRSGFLLMDCLGTQLRYLKACVALALARTASSRQRTRLLDAARHEARRIKRSALPMASPMAHAIEAGISGAAQRRDAQRVSLTAAAEGFHLAEMALHREAARWHLASMPPQASESRQSSAAWMAEQGIVRPESMARAVVPEP
jgi:eukaryotic-like serine/threonine-protein kinase